MSVTGRALPLYDSDARVGAVRGLVHDLWARRGLVRLLVTRDLTVRYKRSVLGVWWTMLNPILTLGVMWVVFSQLFKLPGGRVPYIVYLFSGLVVLMLFQQTVVAVGSSLTAASGVLARIHAPAAAFAASAAIASLVNGAVATVVLLAIEVVARPGLPATVVLAPAVLVLVALQATGLGLAVATLAVRYYDALELTNVLVLLVGYLTPTFYPEAIVPERYRPLLEANPLVHDLRVLRALATEGVAPAAGDIAVAVVATVVMLLAGTAAFARGWRTVAVLL